MGPMATIFGYRGVIRKIMPLAVPSSMAVLGTLESVKGNFACVESRTCSRKSGIGFRETCSAICISPVT